ncbi:sugar phosphate isomerase/epimerase family protein [Chitinasiproducens palmae]|nr:TIM barrel protein [Chitinasiproducens palmae]
MTHPPSSSSPPPTASATAGTDAAKRFRSFTAREGRAAGIVVASAYGADRVRERGQLAAAQWAMAAGADGFEVRAELLPPEWRDRDATAFAGALAAMPGSVGFALVYSTPAEFFGEDGLPSVATVGRALREAQAFGAIALKLQLGPFDAPGRQQPADSDARAVAAASGRRASATWAAHWSSAMDAVADVLRRAPVRVFVENGQSAVGGSRADFEALFASLRANEAWRGAFGMTLDIGNWYWAGDDTASACASLARHVEYVHCKGVQIRDDRYHAVAPDEGIGPWRDWVAALPPALPRGLEFPIVGADPVAATRDALRAVLRD